MASPAPNKTYYIEFYGSKGWEIYESFDGTMKGLHEIIQEFHKLVMNGKDTGWRLTTPDYSQLI